MNETPATKLAAKLTRTITQEQIADYEAHIVELREWTRACEDKKQIIEALERTYDALLSKGYTQEDGELMLHQQTIKRIHTPRYKELYAAIAGPQAVEDAQKSMPVKIYRHVQVMHAIKLKRKPRP